MRNSPLCDHEELITLGPQTDVAWRAEYRSHRYMEDMSDAEVITSLFYSQPRIASNRDLGSDTREYRRAFRIGRDDHLMRCLFRD